MKILSSIYISLYFILVSKVFGLTSLDSLAKILVLINLVLSILILPYILRTKYHLNKYILFFLILVLVEAIISYFNYRQDISDVMSILILYFSFISYYVLSFITKNYKKNNILHKYFIISMTICIMLNTFQYIVFDKGIYLLDINYSFSRYDSLRITANASIINIGLIIITAFILESNKKNKCVFIILFLLGIYNSIFIQKTRSILLITLASIVAMLLLKFKDNFKKIITTTLILVIVILLIIKLPIFDSYFEVKLSDDLGIIARKEAIIYFIDQLKNNFVFGTGIIKPIPGDWTYTYLTGPYNIYYHDDVGIIGFTNKFGIVGFIWYIMLNIKLIIYIWKIRKYNNSVYSLVNVGCVTYITLSMYNLIMMDYQRIGVFIILLSMIERNTEILIDKTKEE